MNVLKGVSTDFVQFFNIKTKKGRIALAFLIIIVFVVFFLLRGSDDVEQTSDAQVRAVRVAQVSSFTEGASLNLIGTVSATSRAIILSEVPGRVTKVSVKLGDAVVLGQKIAQLENTSAYASLLQAEGVYDAAVATSKVSDVSVTQALNSQKSAQNGAVATYRTVYTSVSNILLNTIDDFYSNPEFLTPGVKIRTGRTDFLNSERVSFNDILSKWQQKSVILDNSSDLAKELDIEKQYIQRVLYITDILLSAVNTADNTDVLNGAPLATYASPLNSARISLNNSIASVESSLLALKNAKDTVLKAELGASTGTISVASAQIKQALGALKAAQANYNKTILRSPIAGKINVLDIQIGDHVAAFQKIAEIANNDLLEITTYVGQADRELLHVQQKVHIDGDIDGIISTIAPAVNSETGKFEVKIQTTSKSLVNGSTVSVMVSTENATSTTNQFTKVPLTSVKFTASAGLVYTIEDGVLIEHPVEIGSVRDSFIEIVSGVMPDMEIVADARGLNDGEKVRRIEN